MEKVEARRWSKWFGDRIKWLGDTIAKNFPEAHVSYYDKDEGCRRVIRVKTSESGFWCMREEIRINVSSDPSDTVWIFFEAGSFMTHHGMVLSDITIHTNPKNVDSVLKFAQEYQDVTGKRAVVYIVDDGSLNK